MNISLHVQVSAVLVPVPSLNKLERWQKTEAAERRRRRERKDSSCLYPTLSWMHNYTA